MVSILEVGHWCFHQGCYYCCQVWELREAMPPVQFLINPAVSLAQQPQALKGEPQGEAPSWCMQHTSPSSRGCQEQACQELTLILPAYVQPVLLSGRARREQETSWKTGNQRCILCGSEQNYQGKSITSRALQQILWKMSCDASLSRRNLPWLLNKLW